MAKDKTILIEFDRDITSGFDQNNIPAFTVSSQRYQYIGGPIITVTYPVISVARPQPPSAVGTFNSKSSFNTGTHINTAATVGALTLGDAG